jgi:hypothetical protein
MKSACNTDVSQHFDVHIYQQDCLHFEHTYRLQLRVRLQLELKAVTVTVTQYVSKTSASYSTKLRKKQLAAFITLEIVSCKYRLPSLPRNYLKQSCDEKLF